MKVATRLTGDQQVYVDTVRRALRDAPKDFRDELLADLRAHLDELPPEAPVTEMLGDPSEYARLAREAAGLPTVSARPFAYARALNRRTKIAIASSLAIVLVATTVLVEINHYQPLRTRDLYSWSAQPVVDSPLPSDAQYWRYREGAAVVVGTGLRNSGRATVTVTGVSVPNPSGPFTVVELRTSRVEQAAGSWARATPTQRVSVHPGETIYIFVLMMMSRVHLQARDSESEALPTLKLEVLGVHHLLPMGASDIGVVAQ